MADSNLEIFVNNFQGIDFNLILISIAIILIAFIVSRIGVFLLRYFSEKLNLYRLHVTTIIPIFKVLIYTVAIYYILAHVFSFSLDQLALLIALLGAAIGFGLRNLFEQVAAGIVIAMEKPYQIGDRIEMGDYYGEVRDIGLRSTKFVTPDDNMVSAPNNLILNEAVASGNYGSSEMMAPLDVYISKDSDAELAIRILREAVITSRFVYVSPSRPVIILLNDYPFYRGLNAKAYVNDLRDEFLFRSDIIRRTWQEFDKNGIKAPEVNIPEQNTGIN